MSGKKLAFGALLAIGLLAVSAEPAQAQYISRYGQTFVTPYGGIVSRQAYTNPFYGGSYYNKSYYNPYTGYAAQRQYFAPGFYSPYSYGYGYPAYGYGYPAYGYGFGTFGGISYFRPGFGITFGFGR